MNSIVTNVEVKEIGSSFADTSLLQEVCDVIQESHDEMLKRFGLRINTYGLSAEILFKQLKEDEGLCLVAFNQELVVGTLSVFTDRRKNWYGSGGGRIIKYVAVLPQYQGKHIATLLLDYAKNLNRDKILSISTDERNKPAICLYKKCGFQIVEISRTRNAESNAVRLAYWREGCPINYFYLYLHLIYCRLKCMIKSVL